jgi:hypothetical protein
MPDPNPSISIGIEVLNPQRQFLGGTVDIEFKSPATGQTVNVKGVDASKAIDLTGFQLATPVQYQVTVTPTDTPKPSSQVVTIAPGANSTLTFIIDKASGGAEAVTFTVQGSLVFDHGLPAAGITTRLYSVGYGGTVNKLGEVKSDAQGKYSIAYIFGAGFSPGIQIRVVDSANNEVTISATKFNVHLSEVFNLVVPATVQSLAPEFQRISADMQRTIGGVASLGAAQEGAVRQDLTLLNRSTSWDARLVALAATAAQQVKVTGLGQDLLYTLFRVGLPTDASLLAMVPSNAVLSALKKANQAGVVSMNEREIADATSAFQNFATKARLAMKTPGAVSSFNELLAASLPDANQQTAFASLYFNNPSAADFWTQAANLRIPSKTLDALKLQGKFLYLTFNNGPLAQKLQQDVGALSEIPQIVNKDYHRSDTWQNTLTALAGAGGDQALQKLIPPAYGGKTTADRLAAYAGDLARKVRISFPTQVTARMIERKDLPLSEKTAANVSAFLHAAAPLGYKLGRTPLNAFLKNSSKSLPAMDTASLESLKTVHRLYQITPSSESLQVAMKLGFKSARDIASYTKDEFLSKYGSSFPGNEAGLVYGQAQTVSAVTFNFFSVAKQLDTSPPVYALSPSSGDRQNAMNSIIQQFPSMASLFGNLDFCECEDCRSVLSPAAYFVDVLEFLNQSGANQKGYTPLDVLIGSVDGKLPGRRPDLGALPLTCENTNTAMPYIDLVNEILEYFIFHSKLDANYAYDTGTAKTADLTAEPRHILPLVYTTTLQQAVFPLSLPFDLWIETMRGFLNYFKSPLTQVLDTLRPVDNLELFTDGAARPYYRAQILAEALGLSPSEYAVLTSTDAAVQPLVTNWFKLYGYPDEATALNGKVDPTNPGQYLIPPLKSARNVSQLLGISYQDLTNLMTTGFLNPALYALTFQFQRFGISMSDALAFTNQPGGFKSNPNFGSQLDGITSQYKTQNPSSTFNARTWLTNLLPANYSKKVLVLADPNSGCNFSETSLQYADNATAATPLDFVKFNLFVRLWKKLGWTLDELDRALQLFFPANLPTWTDPHFAGTFSSAWKTALVYLAHLDDLNSRLAPAMGRTALLPFWSNLPVQGENSLYAQLFLTPSVLNNDWAFDDPNGLFPTPASDFSSPAQAAFSAHQAAAQGVLGLTADEIAAIFADQGIAAPAAFTLANLSICYRYSALAKCLQMPVSDMISLKGMSNLNPFQPLSGTPLSLLADDVLFNQTLLFAKEAQAVQNSGFTVEDLKYLLRHQFDPVGKYQTDPNALMALVQSIANGLQQIQSQNAVPPNLTSLPESLIDQSLSGLFPMQILKSLFALLTNTQTYTASQGGVLTAIDTTPFAQETELSFSYDSTTHTQSVSFRGRLLDWKKAALENLDSTAPTAALFSGLLDAIQLQAQAALSTSVGDILGVWASLMEYEAVLTGATSQLPVAPLTQADPALSVSYDQTDQLQWLGYRGVLTDVKKSNLLAVSIPPALVPKLTALLNDVQQQALPAYSQLIGSILAMSANVLTYSARQGSVAPANEIDTNAFFSALTTAQQSGTISGPVPQIQFSYDVASGIQSLTCAGVLTDAMRGKLAALVPTSAVCANLLQAVCTQAVTLFQSLAANLLTVAATDLDNYSQPFLGLDVSKQQKQVKAELVRAFLPLLSQKLSRQLVLQTLSSTLGSDPAITAALVSDAALLTDPSNPGKSLLAAFLALGRQGVSASYFTSTDGSGIAQATGTAATTDTADPTNTKPGTASAHFEGYLQVSTDGPYRFFAELGNAGAAAVFQLDSPDPTALLSNPIIPSLPKAAKNHDEISQFVQLKGGVLYHFTLDFSNLGTNGASLVIQGENLPKGPLSQILLYPQQTFVAFTRAGTLLAKVLQILQGMGLDEREISYLVANSSQFSNLKLSSLPTQPSDDSPANAMALFSQFLTLADYADLRKGPAGGSDGLIDVFQNVGQTFTELASSQDTNNNLATPWARLASLTRRDPANVRGIAEYFGLIKDQVVGPNRQVSAIGDFGNNKGMRHIWQALQLLQIVGIPLASLTASTVIASPAPVGSPDLIAANFKNAVKAQYTADTWRPIAQSVFDKLRQRKRDALVAYLVQNLGLENSEQLFEYFLVDPGMEPVVQTSRLRLAMSSVQTFVQRCLLNLENGNTTNAAVNVAPNAIDADWWSWMKRYRVWQANREIFLFPENWMVPELRLDKTDLFTDLESALLQGDVTIDLANDAFFAYLKGLDLRARLDIVAMYLDQDVTHGISTLHVLGRTYGHPHKYFYRTYSNATWSGWVAVTPDIEGNHITLVIWKGRLNIFWVTFISQPQPPQSVSTGAGVVSNLTFDQLGGAISDAQAIPQYQVQLHWIEYFQGKWTNRISTDINTSAIINGMDQQFDPDSDAVIHVTREVDSAGNEGAVRIHLDLKGISPHDDWDFGYAFRVTSKNCSPDFGTGYWERAQILPYQLYDADATEYLGKGMLQARIENQVSTDGTESFETEEILQTVNDYAVLPCANPVVPPFADPNASFFIQDAGSLVAPFFFKDTRNPNAGGSSLSGESTFFVQPALTETTIEQWTWWAPSPAIPAQDWSDPNVFNNIPVIAQVPTAGPFPVNPGDPVYSIYRMQNTSDWLTNPATAVSYGGSLIGKSGGIGMGIVSTLRSLGGVASSASGMIAGLAGGQLRTGLTVVGSQGLSLSQLQAMATTQPALPLTKMNRRIF